MSNYNPPGDFPDVALLIILGGIGWTIAFYISRYAKKKHQETYLRDKWKRAARRVTKTKKGQGILRQNIGFLRKKLKNSSKVNKVEHRATVSSIKSTNVDKSVDSDTEVDPELALKAEQEARIKKIEGMFEYVIKRNKL